MNGEGRLLPLRRGARYIIRPKESVDDWTRYQIMANVLECNSDLDSSRTRMETQAYGQTELDLQNLIRRFDCDPRLQPSAVIQSR